MPTTRKRRAHGEGGIRQRADGRWEASLYLDDGRRKFLYAKTRAEVREKLLTALQEKRTGALAAAGAETLGDYLTRWLRDCVGLTVAHATFLNYRACVNLHTLPFPIAGKRLTAVTPAMLQAHIKARVDAGLSPARARLYRTVMHNALNQAVQWNLLARNPVDQVKAPRVVEREMEPLSADQAKRLLEVLRPSRLYPIVALALALGMRRGELLGLHWSDVDLDSSRLLVRYALKRGTSGMVIGETKRRTSRRTIPLPELAITVLKEQRERQAVARLLSGSRWRESGLVFTSRDGTAFDVNGLARGFKKALAEAGLPDIRFHDLRHTCASLLLSQGLSPRVIMEILGHSNIGVTMNLYAHVMPDLQRQAAKAIDDLFK